MYQSQIKSFEDACKYLAIAAALPIVVALPEKNQKAIVAFYQLFVIAEALNKEANDGKEWQPKYDGSEWHYYPYFYRGDESGSGFRFGGSVCDYRCSAVGSRLEFISEEVSDYAGKTFLDLYRDAHVMQGVLAFPEEAKS